MTQITIIGLGLIGSSIGMAIRSARKNVTVIGFDHNSAVQSRAKKIGAIDDNEWRLEKAVEDADLVVLGQDILTIDAVQIKDIPILRTMTHGKFVYVNPDQDPQQEVHYIRYPARTPYIN